MQKSGFKKSVYGLNSKDVFSYLDTMSKDIEKKLRSKDETIKELHKQVSEKEINLDKCQNELSDLKDSYLLMEESYKKTIDEQRNSFLQEFEKQKNTYSGIVSDNQEKFEKAYNSLKEKYDNLVEEYTCEKEKIGNAILNAEDTGKEIIAKATQRASEIVAEAKLKAEVEKEKYRKSKADVSDFTYDIKKLLDKLTGEIKEKIDK